MSEPLFCVGDTTPVFGVNQQRSGKFIVVELISTGRRPQAGVMVHRKRIMLPSKHAGRPSIVVGAATQILLELNSMNLIDYVLPGTAIVRGYAERLLKDISPETFARKPVVQGQVVDTNHPAFVYGHLAIFPVQLAAMMELPTDGMEMPPSYSELFSIGAVCVDDVDGTVYPAMAEVVEGYFTSYDRLLTAIKEVDPAVLTRPLENPQRRERFGTIGAFTTYLLLAHPQSHFGQVSVWRRCMGLGAA